MQRSPRWLQLNGGPYSLQYLLGHDDMSTVREYVKIAAMDASELYRSPLDALGQAAHRTAIDWSNEYRETFATSLSTRRAKVSGRAVQIVAVGVAVLVK